MQTSRDSADFDYEAFCSITEETEANIKHKIDMCLEYLSDFKSPSTLISNSNAYKLMFYLNGYTLNNSYLIRKLFQKQDLLQLFVDLLSYYKPELKQLLIICSKSNGANVVDETYLITSNQQFEYLNQLMIFLCNITNESRTFCYKFHDLNGTQIMLDYLKDSILIKKLLKFKRKNLHDSIIDEIGFKFFETFVTTFYNLTSIVDYKKTDFETMNTTQIMRQLGEQFKDMANIRVLIYLILANVVNDYEIETLPCMRSALTDIIDLIKRAATMIADTTKPVSRMQIDIDPSEEIEILEEVCVLSDGWNIVELFIALYRLAVNDTIKTFISERLNDDLKKIIYTGNKVEIEYSLRLLWQLCFDSKIATTLHEDEKILQYVEDLLRSEQSSSSIKRYSEGILWSVKKQNDTAKCDANTVSAYSAGPSKDDDADVKKHIMISYNSYSREMCLKVKAELEKYGYKIWIDVEKIHGSSLEAMAKAIEESQCVLMVMTENYKQSPNCRAEAEYAFRLNVPIVPLIMQPSYMPDGWLGIILGSKIFINYTKYPFDECMRRLLIELKPLEIKPNKQQPIDDTKKAAASPVGAKDTSNSRSDVKAWTNSDVQKWIAKNKFHDDIKAILNDFDGEKLSSMNSIRLKAPEYFYKSLSRDRLDLNLIVNFNCEFEKLFEN